MARLGRAYAARARFGRKVLRPYDAPPNTPRRGAAIVANDASDGGTAWDISSYIFFGSLPGDTLGGPVSLTVADNAPSQYLVLTGFNILIASERAIADIRWFVHFDSFSTVPDLTVRLIRNGVIQTPSHIIPANVYGSSAENLVTGTLVAPYTPAELNASNWGLAIRKAGSENCAFTIYQISVVVALDSTVLSLLTYTAGTYTFGPTAIPVDATTILFFLDAVLHTDPAKSVRLIADISYNSGADWSGLMDSGVNVGGTFSRESGITEPRWWSRMGLLDPTNANRQFKGSLIIAGGSIATSVGAFTTIES